MRIIRFIFSAYEFRELPNILYVRMHVFINCRHCCDKRDLNNQSFFIHSQHSTSQAGLHIIVVFQWAFFLLVPKPDPPPQSNLICQRYFLNADHLTLSASIIWPKCFFQLLPTRHCLLLALQMNTFIKFLPTSKFLRFSLVMLRL